MSAMEPPLGRPDRAAAEADKRHLANLQPDAVCDLPAERVYAYVSAYLSNLPSPEPSDTTPKPNTDPPANRLATADLLAKIKTRQIAPPILNLGSIKDPTTPKVVYSSFRPSLSIYTYAAIGIALIAAVNLLFEGGAEKMGEALVTAVLGARALDLGMTRRLRSDFQKSSRSEQEEVRRPLADANIGVQLLAYFAAAFALWGILYSAPRLFDFEVDSVTTGFSALLVVGLLALEWGIFPDRDPLGDG